MQKKVRYLLLILSIVGLFLFIIPFLVARILNIGNITGIIVFLLILIYAIFMFKINKFIIKYWKFKIAKFIICFIGLIIALICSLVIILSILMYSAANQQSNDDYTLVVLGCGVNKNQPSLMLTERLEAAYKYLYNNENSKVVLSGGQGYKENISEAECMYDYLVSKGIDKNRLFIEDQSTSTRENLIFSNRIIQANDMNTNIAIVTNEFHEYRAKLVADSLDINSIAFSAKTAWWLFPTYYVRELYGILYQLVF